MRRVQILLKADVNGPGWRDAKIAEAFGYQAQTIEHLRKRLVTEGFDNALDGKKRERPPSPRRLDGQGEAKLIATRLGNPRRLQQMDAASSGRRRRGVGGRGVDQSRNGSSNVKKMA